MINKVFKERRFNGAFYIFKKAKPLVQ